MKAGECRRTRVFAKPSRIRRAYKFNCDRSCTSSVLFISCVLNLNPASFDGFFQNFVVGFGLVSIFCCKLYDRIVEFGVRSHITSNHRRIARAPMRSSESPSARFGKIGQERGVRHVKRHPYFHVAKLANVEMPSEFQSDRPAEENIARGLHQTLSHHHSLAMSCKHAASSVALQHRSPGFLDLEKQGSVFWVRE